MNAEDTQITMWVSASKWGKRLNARQMCVDTNAISKNLAYYMHRKLNDAHNTQQKLGVAFSYLERN